MASVMCYNERDLQLILISDNEFDKYLPGAVYENHLELIFWLILRILKIEKTHSTCASSKVARSIWKCSPVWLDRTRRTFIVHTYWVGNICKGSSPHAWAYFCRSMRGKSGKSVTVTTRVMNSVAQDQPLSSFISIFQLNTAACTPTRIQWAGDWRPCHCMICWLTAGIWSTDAVWIRWLFYFI